VKDLVASEGTIVTFNATFEKARPNEMSRDSPDYRPWFENIRPRIADLIIGFIHPQPTAAL